MAALPAAQRAAGAIRASMAAAAKSDSRLPGYIARFGPSWKRVRTRISKAKYRCENPDDPVYAEYGGRGIKFVFPSVTDATVWVLSNLGTPPPGKSLDRVDNARHYEPGNLRWATASEQNINKREYRRSVVGERVRGISALRQDLTEQTIRTWIKQGLTDDEITGRRKHIGCGVRHTQLRPPE